MTMDPMTAMALASAGISLGSSLIHGGRARRLRKEYDEAERSIPYRDPMSVSFLDQVRQQRRAFMSGTDPIAAYARQQVREAIGQTQASMVRSGRATPADLLASQLLGDKAVAAAGARSAQMGSSLLGMEGTLISSLSEREWRMRMARARRLWAEYAAAREGSNRNLMAGLGMLTEALPGIQPFNRY